MSKDVKGVDGSGDVEDAFDAMPPPDDFDAPFHDDLDEAPLDFAISQPASLAPPAQRARVDRDGSRASPLPSDIDAERAILSSALIDPLSWIYALGRVEAGDFWDRRHALIFEAIFRLALANRPFDAVSVKAELERMGKLDQAGGLDYLVGLSSFVGSSQSMSHYAHLVQRLAAVRRVIAATHRIQSEAVSNPGDPDHVISTAQTELGKALDGAFGAEAVPVSAVVGHVFEKVLAARASGGEVVGIPTGYKRMDDILMGLHRTDLVILAARPAMGKTAFALNIALNVARNRIPMGKRAGELGSVMIFSLEMGKEQLVQRLLSQRARIGLSELRRGTISPDDEVSLRTAAADLSELKIFLDDTAFLTTVDLMARAKRTHMQHGLDVIVVDYLQLMKGTGGSRQSREQEISEISRTLKGLAKDLDVTVIALSQLNRSLESRTDKRPMMSDLRESGAIEQDADIILFIYRDWIYHKEVSPEHLAEIIIAKHRAGETGKLDLHFEGRYTRFSNIDVRMGDDYAGVGPPRFG